MLNPDPFPTSRLTFLSKLLASVAGADSEILALCPRRDLESICAVAEIMIFTALYQFSLFTVVGTRLFAASGPINPAIPAIAAFIALFILKVDAYTIMRSGWHLSGVAEIKRGGLDISGGTLARVKSACLLSIRILLAFGLAQLTAIFVCDLVFTQDINARIESDNRHANAPLVVAATERVDADLQRQRDAIASETEAIGKANGEALALRQRENDLTSVEPRLQEAQTEVVQLMTAKAKADDELREAETFALDEAAGIKGVAKNTGLVGEGPRYHAATERVTNAKARATNAAAELDAARGRVEALNKESAARTEAARQQIKEQLASVEKSVTDARVRLTSLNEQLMQLVRGRDSAIQAAVVKAQDYVPRRDGLLIQIAALRNIANDNPEIAIVILLIEVTSFGFELAAVLAKVTSFVPTSYAAYLARDAYMRVVSLVDAMVQELDEKKSEPQAAKQPSPAMQAANDNQPHASEAGMAGIDDTIENGSTDEPSPPEPPQPPKRPRGRPRKTPAA